MGRRAGTLFIRYGVPLVLLAGGIAGVVIGHARTAVAAAGVAFMVIALMVWMLGWMFRMSVDSNRDREREEAARDHFARTGRWPDDAESAGADSVGSSAGAELPEGRE